MQFAEIPEVWIEPEGVSFKYLLLVLNVEGQTKTLLRAVNYKPYDPPTDSMIIDLLGEELDSLAFEDDRDSLEVLGGGSLSLNPYYETVTVYGRSPIYGEEPDRESTAQVIRTTYPSFEVEWRPAEEEKEEKPVKKPPVRKNTAAESEVEVQE